MNFEQWAKSNLGKGIDWDGVYGVQCVDLVNHYIKNVLGINPVMIGNAIEFYNKRNTSSFLKNNFDWISNTPDFIPKKGDIGVFKTKSGFGHICVCTGEGTTSYFYSYDQNYPFSKHEPMTKIRHTYPNFLGVLRPKEQGGLVKYGNAVMLSAQNVYCDSMLKNRIGSVSKDEGVYYLGTGNGNICIIYKCKDYYKAGWVKSGAVEKTAETN